MIGPCLSALAGHWRRRPGQALVLIIGLAIATALWTGVQAINAQARASYDAAEALLAGNRLDSVIRTDGRPLTEADFATLRRGGWRVSPILEGRLRRAGRSYRLIGIDVLTLPQQAALAPDAAPATLSAFVAPPYEVLAAPQTAAALDPAGLPPIRIVDALPPGTLVLPIGVAQALLARPAAVSRLLLSPVQKPARRELAKLGPYATEPPPTASSLGSLTDSFHLNLTAFGLMAFVVGLFIVHGTIGLAFEQRRGLIRTLRALGVPLKALVLALLVEVTAFAALSGLIGVLLGYLIAAALLPDVAASLGSLYGAAVPGALTLSPLWWLGGLAMALAGALAAALSHLWALTRMQVLAPAQQQAWLASTYRRIRLQLALAGVATAIGAATVLWGHGLIAGFTVMAAALLAAALALPFAVVVVVNLAARLARGAVWQWFWADTKAQLSGLSLALMALLLALAINIGVGSMVGGFRITFLAWLDQRLAPDIFVRSTDLAARDRIAAALAAHPAVATVLPVENGQTRLAGWPVDIIAIRDHALYRDNWPLLDALPDAWDRLAQGEAVAISEQTARKLGLQIGDRVAFSNWRPELVGIFADYGNPTGAMLLNQTAFASHFPPADRHSAAAVLRPGQAGGMAAQVVAELSAQFGLSPAQLLDQAGLKAQARRVFEGTFKVTAALNGLTLGVAGLALTTALLTLAQIRLPQLAPAWAMGLTRRQLGGIELARAAMLALITAVLAIPLGILFAWILTAIINVEAFGWKLPLYQFPGQWLALTALALLTAVLASLWPVAKLRRTPPAQLARVFSDDR